MSQPRIISKNHHTISVSPIGYGCMGLSHAYGAPCSDQDCIKAIHHALDCGYTLFDTAHVYGHEQEPQHNERILGEALQGKRDQVCIVSKFGLEFDFASGLEHIPLLHDSRPETIEKSLELSLKLLKTDHLDVYLQHRPDPNVEPEVIAETMAKFIQQGKILAWGISEGSIDYVKRAHAVCPVSTIQNRYSLMYRDYEAILPDLEAMGISFMAYSPLANGFLSGAYTKDTKFGEHDYRSFMAQYTEEGFAQAQALLDLLHNLAEQKQATMAQITLAWLLHQRPYIIPIPGTRNLDRIKENIDSQNISLTAEELASINQKLDGVNFSIFGRN